MRLPLARRGCTFTLGDIRVMKPSSPPLVWFFVGTLLGLLTDRVLFTLWLHVGALEPGITWLTGHGLTALAGCWAAVWPHVPLFFVATCAGIVGGAVIKSHPVRELALFGLGFVIVPWVADYRMVADLNMSDTGLTTTALRIGVYQAVVVALALTSAFVSRWLARQRAAVRC